MICAKCGEPTPVDPCARCGEPTTLRGWVLEKVVAQGSASVTYRATRDGAVAAVKELPLRRADTAKALELFEREARVLASLAHPGIAHHLDHFVEGTGRDAALYVLTRWVDGPTLEAELEAHRYCEDEVLDVVAEVLDTLAHLHRQSPPVLHRDLAPSNLVRGPDGHLVLVDFGATRDVEKDPDLGGSTVTGTFGFMAPEQFAGDATPASDLYGLGVLAAWMLTRQPPRKLLDHHGHLCWQPHTRVGPVTEALLNALLVPDPSARAQDAAAVRDWLLRARRARTTLAPVPGARSATPPSTGLSRRAAGSMVLGAGAATVAVTTVTVGLALLAAVWLL